MKDFEAWGIKKKKIDLYVKFQHPKVGEIWWCSIGVNVGTEIYGKGKDFLRPILVVKCYRESFLGIPLSSKVRNTDQIHIEDQTKRKHVLVLQQIRALDKRRLVKKISKVIGGEYNKVKLEFHNIIK